MMQAHGDGDMYWFVYTIDEHGRLSSLRGVEANDRPQGHVLNDGFRSAEEGLALMSHYLRLDREGFAHIDMQKARRSPTRVERFRLAYQIEPRMIWLVIAALSLGLLNLVLIVLHLAI